MFLCLSSGASARYRQDVLRALAMPSGTDLQFRYRRKWLSQKIFDELGRVEVSKPTALIAFIDQADPIQTPVLIPCRFAKIIGAIKHGTTVSLTLRIGGFALGEDLVAANTELRTLATGVPTYENGTLVGYWCTDLSAMPPSIADRKDLAAWELIVEQLCARKEFAQEELFYIVRGIVSPSVGLLDGGDGAVAEHFARADGGRIVMNGGAGYEIQVYHYHPKAAPSKPISFVVESTSPILRFSTPTKAPIDSAYDMKRFRLRTETSLDDEQPVISVRSDDGGGLSANSFGIDILTTVKGNRLRYFGYGALIGFLIGLPPAIAALLNSGLSPSVKAVVAFISLLGGFAAGQIAAFGLKKL